MKTLLLPFIFLSGTLLANANTDWVDKQVQSIKPPRTGISHAAIDKVKNPFIFVYKPKEGASKDKTNNNVQSAAVTKPAPLQLTAVMNNSALIDGTWYQVNDKVRGYTLSKIESDAVQLQMGKSKKMLFITEANPNIKIQVK